MHIVRTVVWVLLIAALSLFTVYNWSPVEVKIWDGLVVETKIPALVIVSFLLGILPMWLLHIGTRWRMSRRISALESASRNAGLAASTRPVDSMSAPTHSDEVS